MLDEPPRLVGGLAYLALAQAATGDTEAAGDTLGRLIAVDERFGAYAEAPLPDAARGQLEELMLAQVPETALLASPTFHRLGDEKFARRLAAMAPRERRAALLDKAAAEPGEVRWQLELARLDLEERQLVEAVRRATLVLTAEPDNEPARCIRGVALAGTGACETAVVDLEACSRSRSEASFAEALAGCQATLGRWREAAAFLASLPPAVRQSRPLSKLERRVGRQVARLPVAADGAVANDAASGDATGGDTAGGDTAGVDTGAGTPAAAARGIDAAEAAAEPPLPADARARLREARRLLAAATRAGDLQQPLALAKQVADAYPASREAQHLAGEIAYRASSWQEAATYFRRGGDPERPELRFYMAVSLFESGDPQAAAAVLERALPDLPRSPFVTSYIERIQAAQAP